MDPSAAKDIVNRFYDADALRQSVVRIAQTPVPQTRYYEREPLILDAIQSMYRPALEQAGCDTYIDDYGNLIATQGRGEGPSLLFLSYAMAWMEGTMPNPWSGEVMDGGKYGVEGEIVWGRGGSEYHPSNAAILETARLIHESGTEIDGKITYVISSAGHTSSSDPAYRLLFNNQITADMCVSPGPNFVCFGHKGRLDLRVHVHGKSVHSGGDIEVGSNAIEGGIRVLERLAGLMPFPPGAKEDPDMGIGRLSVIGLASYPPSPGFHLGVGSGGHTLQNLMRILLDRRIVPGEDVETAIAEIKDAVGDMSPWRVTFERGALQYPSKLDKDSPLVSSIAEVYSVMHDREPEYDYVDSTIDAGFLNMNGIPSLKWGGIDKRFSHSDTDFAQLSVCEEVAKGYAFWALRNATTGR